MLMCACLLVVQRQAARLAAPHERAAAWALALLPLLAGAIVRVRFDLFAVALAVAGLRLVIDRRTVPGFALLGLGAATKVFPIVFAAAGVAWLLGRGRHSEAVRGAAVTVGVIAAVCLPFALAAPDGFAEQVRFHAERPLQIESLPATLARLVGEPEVTGTTAHPDRFRSQGVRDDTLAALFTALQLAAVLAAVAWAYRSRPSCCPPRPRCSPSSRSARCSRRSTCSGSHRSRPRSGSPVRARAPP